mgnify:CR=1 FL=1
MPKEIKLPAFNFLGFNIQQINLKRIGNETLEEIKINIPSAKYDENKKIYSLVLTLSIDFQNSKGSLIEILGGFKVNDEKILNNRDAINSIFSASLYPYLRTVFHNITSDDRLSLMLPTLDLRNVDLRNGISLKPNIQNK